MPPHLDNTVEIEVWSRAVAGFATKEGSRSHFAAIYADDIVEMYRERIGQAERWADLRKAGEALVHEQRNALLALTRGVPTEDPNLLRVYAALDEFAKVLRG